MKRGRIGHLTGLLGVLAVLSACAGAPGGGAGTFRQEYAAAREALEGGDHARAATLYGRMLERDLGPLEPRLRLEYAHALLRADRFEAAAAQGVALANSQSGAARAAALAVVGAAQHERARRRMAAGDFGAETEALLRSAQAALSEMLSSHPDLDPQGGMAARRAEIGRDLAEVARYRASGG